MPTTSTNAANGSQLVVVGDTGGVTLVDRATPLKRLNFYDGKFMRADDFNVEQSYLRQLVALSNQGLGPGVVYGYDTVLAAGDTIQIGPGLAIDPSGKVLLLQSTVTQGVQALIDASKVSVGRTAEANGKTGPGTFSDCVVVAATPPTVITVSDLYVISICAAEALCGQEDVYGRLCEEACASATDRPYRLDGLVLRAMPLPLMTAFPTSKVVAIDADRYLRSEVAHSWYADEVLKHPDAISRAGLLSNVWCLGAGYDAGACVPLAVVARAGATTIFLDAWIVRRERIETPPRRYWQWKMRMRPWDVFLAQILQFQCQLADVLTGVVTPGGRTVDPCATQNQALSDAVQFLDDVRTGFSNAIAAPANANVDLGGGGATGAPSLMRGLSFTRISDLQSRFEQLLKNAAVASAPTDRILLQGGIIELPSAGYLPVVNGTSVTVNDQVRALLGDGVDLRFCVVTADFVAHAIEKAQHMDRISLIEGLDQPTNKAKVDVLVPDGHVVGSRTSPSAGLYRAALTFSTEETGGFSYRGGAREAALPSGGSALYSAGVGRGQAVASALGGMLAPSANNLLPLRRIDLTPDLATNAWVQVDPTTVPTFATRLETTLEAARAALAGAGQALPPPPTGAAATDGTIDGYWLTARSDDAIKDLAAPNQTRVSGRFIAAQSSEGPLAAEFSYHGALTVQSTSADGSLMNVALNLMLTVAVIQMDAAEEREAEVIWAERVNWPARITFSGDSQDGSVTVDIAEPGAAPMLRASRTISGGSSVTYQLLRLASGGNQPNTAAFHVFGKVVLDADPAGAQPQNANHVFADDGIILVQAALLETEDTFRQEAETALFPTLAPATTELTIQAVRDWVAFVRRREEQCALDVAPPPPVPPQTYRIFNILAESVADAKKTATTLAQQLTTPAQLAATVQQQLALQQHAGLDLVVTFAGGSAQPLFNPLDAEKDWKRFGPGETIFFAAVGARGDTSGSLQKSRLVVFENAIRADSTEDSSAIELPIAPLPGEAVPPDANGIMLFVTATGVTTEDVFEVDSGESTNTAWDELVKTLPTGSQDQIAALMLRAEARRIGTLTFRGETTQFADNATAVIKTPLLGKVIERMCVWSNAGDPMATLREQQAEAFRTGLAELVPSSTQLVTCRSTQATVPPPGPAIVFLRVRTIVDRNDLIVVARKANATHTPIPDMPHAVVRFRDGEPLGTSLDDFVKKLSPAFAIGEVALFTRGAPDAAVAERQKAVFDALANVNRLATNAQLAPNQPKISASDLGKVKNLIADVNAIDDVIFLVP